MIAITSLTSSDIGKTVWYKPFGEPEEGILKSWNNRYIFVVYFGSNIDKKERFMDYTAAATEPEDLFWTKEEAEQEEADE